MMKLNRFFLCLTVLLFFAILPPMHPFAGSKEIRIGVLVPLSGPLAPIGKSLKEGAEVAIDLVNTKSPGIGVSIAEWEGIPSMGGAKIRLIIVDSRGDPSWSAEQTRKLIREEKVEGLLGGFQSSVTETASAEAERAGIPFINSDSISPGLSKRGFKWFWRVTPHEAWFTKDFFDFLDGLVAGRSPGIKAIVRGELEPLAAAAENTEWGTAALSEIERFSKEQGWRMVESLKYPHKAADLTNEARRLVATKAPTLLFVSYAADAVLFVKALKEMKATPRLIWGQNTGFMAPDFTKVLGADINGTMSRGFFSPALNRVRPEAAKINKIFKERTGYDFDGNSARNFTGAQVLAHALNKAGSTDPRALQKALNELHITGQELIMPWRGIRFGSPFPGDTQQNELGSGIIIQHQGYPDGKQEIVYPFEMATSKLIFPFPGWK